MVDAMAMAAEERADLADLLESLTAEQWATPSLCPGWSVRDVAAHVVSHDDESSADTWTGLFRAGLRFSSYNEAALARYTHLDQRGVVDVVRRHLVPRGGTARMGGKVGLTDCLVHHQDIRRPLGLPREIPLERLRVALDFAVTAPLLLGFWQARGVRLVASDVGWSRGRGPEARGPAEAVIMAMCGRAGIARELEGPGALILAERFG